MSLLAELCLKLHAHPEVLATEALGLVLNERELSKALAQFLSLQLDLTDGLPADLRFATQQSSEGDGRPDIVGVTQTGLLSLIIEVKFWAALTDKQPNAYLETLLRSNAEKRALVFVAPAIRHEVLWAELARKVVATGRVLTNTRRVGQDVQVAIVDGVPLALMSWRSVLATLSHAAAANGGVRASDIEQLSALVSRMDTDAFLPLRGNELSSQVGLRLYQLNEIVDEVVAVLVAEHVCTKSRKSAGKAYYGAALLLRNHWLYFELSFWHWGQYAATPFWLVYTPDPDGTKWPVLDSAFVPLTQEIPPRLMKGRQGETPMIPLHAPTGVEKHQVVRSLCDQIRHAAELLPQAAVPSAEPLLPGQATESG